MGKKEKEYEERTVIPTGTKKETNDNPSMRE
jgi:hypothetical protein